MFLLHTMQHVVLQAQPMLHAGHLPGLTLANVGLPSVDPAPTPTPTAGGPPDGSFNNLSNLLSSVEDLLKWLGGILCAIGIMVAAILRITAFGSERKIAVSNMAIGAAIVGLIILLLATAFQKFITNHLQPASVALPPVAFSQPVQSRSSVTVEGSHVTIILPTQGM